jgi:LysR family transcriptional activator of nhaA
MIRKTQSDALAAFEWLNYHHLLYFWMVAREGGLSPAAARLRLSPPTLSGQIRALELSLGEKLFQKDGRKLALTEMGRVVYRYAEEIFSLGRELLDTVRGRPTGRPIRFNVGIDDAVPKMVTRLLLLPAQRLSPPLQLVCREDHVERLVTDLAAHGLDAVLSDGPAAPRAGVRVYNHLLGECEVAIFGVPQLARRYATRFPRSLDGAPFLLPTEPAATRRGLDDWMARHDIRPTVVAEFDDSALLKTFGQGGDGLFAAPNVLADEIERQHHVKRLGVAEGLTARFYLITAERRLKHPGVVAISEAAKNDLFAEAPAISERAPEARTKGSSRGRGKPPVTPS